MSDQERIKALEHDLALMTAGREQDKVELHQCRITLMDIAQSEARSEAWLRWFAKTTLAYLYESEDAYNRIKAEEPSR